MRRLLLLGPVVALLLWPGAPGHAVPLVPAVHATAGTATVTDAGLEPGSRITLSGSIVVGSEEFVGTASGVTNSYLPGSDFQGGSNVLNPFVLEGPDLTGTCAGHWALVPGSATSGVESATGVYGLSAPVFAGWLSCSLQLGQSAPAQTGVSLVVAQTPPAWDASGVFGPGPSAGPLPAPVSLGTADAAYWSDASTVYGNYDLIGDIVIGGTVFTGHASGHYVHEGWEPVPPFTLAGTSPSGDLSATCTQDVPALDLSRPEVGLYLSLEQLACTGQVGTGPPGTVTLFMLLPIRTDRFGGCGRCSGGDRTGVFFAA
jgi:hypothetical protein